MKSEQYSCDVCGAVKREANHWFRAERIAGGGFLIAPWSLAGFVPLDSEKVLHLCGTLCATKAMCAAMAEV